MERNRAIATLERLGGHPALDFTNTVIGRRGPGARDLLGSVADLVDWGVRLGLLPPERAAALRHGGDSDAALLARAKDLREAIFRLFSAPGAPTEADDLALLSHEAAEGQAQRCLQRSATGAGWAWSTGTPPALVGQVAHLAAELLVGADAVRVRECPGRDCAWLFLDTTRNGHRRYCSDRDCGSLDRVRRHRARKRLTVEAARTST